MEAIEVKPFSLRLNPELHTKLKIRAALEQVYMNDFIVSLIKRELEKEKSK